MLWIQQTRRSLRLRRRQARYQNRFNPRRLQQLLAAPMVTLGLLAAIIVACPRTALAAGTPADSVSAGSVTWNAALVNATYGVAANTVYTPPPSGSAPLDLSNPNAIVTSGATLSSSSAFSGFDPAGANAYITVFLAATAGYYRPATNSIGSSAAKVWNDLYSSPTTAATLTADVSSLLIALSSSGMETTTSVAADQSLFVNNLAILGVTITPTTPPPATGPLAISGDALTINSQFSANGYTIANAVVRPSTGNLTVNDAATIVSNVSSAVNSDPLQTYSTVLAFAFAAWNTGPTPQLRQAGENVFNDLMTTSPTSVSLTGLNTDAVDLQARTVLDGNMTASTTPSVVHNLLQGLVSLLGMTNALPAAPPIPQWQAIATIDNGNIAFDATTQSNLYQESYTATFAPASTTITQTPQILTRVDAGLASSQSTTDPFRYQQELAFAETLGLADAAYWNGSTARLEAAGGTLFNALMTETPEPVATLIQAEQALYTDAVLDKQFGNWPLANALGSAFTTDLASLGIVGAMPTLTAIFGPNPAAAQAALPGTSFSVANNTSGGTISGAANRLQVPNGCVTTPTLISATTIQTNPTVADLDIHGSWGSCQPTISLTVSAPGPPTFLAELNPSGHAIDLPAAITSAGWASTPVTQLGMFEDVEDPLVTILTSSANSLETIRSTAPNCSSVGVPDDLATLSMSEPAGNQAPWQTCYGVSNGIGNLSAAFNMGFCGPLSSNRTVTLTQAQAFEPSLGANLICPGTQLVATVPQGSSIALNVAPHLGLTAAYHLTEIVPTILTAAGHRPFANLGAFQGALATCLAGTLGQPAYQSTLDPVVTADTTSRCIATAEGTEISSGLSVTNVGIGGQDWEAADARFGEALGEAIAATIPGPPGSVIGQDLTRSANLTFAFQNPPPPTTTPPSPAGSSLQANLTLNPVPCDATTHGIGSITGANAGERITFTSPGLSLLAGSANSSGSLGIIWTCSPSETNKSWAITARAATSGRTVTFVLRGGTPGSGGSTPGPPGGSISPPAPILVNQFYNRSAAVSWALANAQNVQRWGAQCTWFVSNALWAGGFPQDSQWTSSGSHSIEHYPGTVTAWGVPNLIQYLMDHYSVTWYSLGNMSQNAVPQAQPGDIIVYSWDGGKSYDHMAFVVDIAAGQYPEVAEWGQDENFTILNTILGNWRSPYVKRGWTYSALYNVWLQNDPKVGGDVRAFLLHINGGVFLPNF